MSIYDRSQPEEEGEFEVDSILNHRTRAGKKEYLIRWKEFGPEEDSWEPLSNLDHCRDLVEYYNRFYHTSITPGTSSSTLSSRPYSVSMPAKAKPRSRSSSRSRTSVKASPSRSPSRKSSRTSAASSKKSEGTKSPSRSSRSPARASKSPARTSKSPARTSKSPARTSRSPARTSQAEVSSAKKVAAKKSPSRSTRSSRSSESSEKVTLTSTLSPFLLKANDDLARKGYSVGRRTQQEVVVQRSEVSYSGRQVQQRVSKPQLEMYSDDDDDIVQTKTESQDQVDSEATSWFAQKRQEMLQSLTSSKQSQSAAQPLAVQEGSSWSFLSSGRRTWLGIRKSNIPITIFIICLLIIGLSFLIEEYF